nr:hypothetical protein [Bacilli bacterium]
RRRSEGVGIKSPKTGWRLLETWRFRAPSPLLAEPPNMNKEKPKAAEAAFSAKSGELRTLAEETIEFPCHLLQLHGSPLLALVQHARHGDGEGD